LPPISTLELEFMTGFGDMLETITDAFLWVDYTQQVRVWDNRNTKWSAVRAAGPETSSAEKGSSNFFVTKQVTLDFEQYFTDTYPYTPMPTEYGFRKSKRRFDVKELAVEMALTLKMSAANLAPHIYAAFMSDFSLSQRGMNAKAVYIMESGIDLFYLMNVITAQIQADPTTRSNWSVHVRTISAQLLRVVENLSRENLVLTDIRPENVIVMGMDRQDPSTGNPDVKLIDFDQTFSGVLELHDADDNCVFILNALLFLNNVLTDFHANKRQSDTSNRMVVSLLDDLVSHYRELMSRMRTNPSMQASLCNTVLNVSKSSPLFNYQSEKRRDDLDMYNSTQEKKAKRILERIMTYGRHDQPVSGNGIPSVMNELRADQIIWRISDQLLEHFDDLKRTVGLL